MSQGCAPPPPPPAGQSPGCPFPEEKLSFVHWEVSYWRLPSPTPGPFLAWPLPISSYCWFPAPKVPQPGSWCERCTSPLCIQRFPSTPPSLPPLSPCVCPSPSIPHFSPLLCVSSSPPLLFLVLKRMKPRTEEKGGAKLVTFQARDGAFMGPAW